MTTKQKRLPQSSQLTVAILEHYVSTLLGDKAIEEIKSPLIEKQLRESLATALAEAEKRFISEHSDRVVAEAVMTLPLADLPSMNQAVTAFHNRPTDDTLANTIREHLAKTWPQFSKKQVEVAVLDYIAVLRKELAAAIPTVRESLNTLANIETGENTALIAEKLDKIIELLTPTFAIPRILGNIPPRPTLVIGRENDLKHLKGRLGITTDKGSPPSIEPLTVVRGWPGVGKTTLVNTLAYEPEIALAFPDGVLWAALGENPNPFSELTTWGRTLGITDVDQFHKLEEIIAQLTAALRDKQMLLIVDDVWQSEHGVPFRVAGPKCTLLFTTRFNDVADALVDRPEQVYWLPELSNEDALRLLATLTPITVKQHPKESLVLVQNLEGLPLAIQVAGRLLKAEAKMGWGVKELIEEIQEGAKLLKAIAPADRADLVTQTTPTVAALLKRSTDRLDEETRVHFAFLGAFAPKPAKFELAAMADVWEVENPRPHIRKLVDRGLLEPVGEWFQMHALLVMHARSLLNN